MIDPFVWWTLKQAPSAKGRRAGPERHRLAPNLCQGVARQGSGCVGGGKGVAPGQSDAKGEAANAKPSPQAASSPAKVESTPSLPDASDDGSKSGADAGVVRPTGADDSATMGSTPSATVNTAASATMDGPPAAPSVGMNASALNTTSARSDTNQDPSPDVGTTTDDTPTASPNLDATTTSPNPNALASTTASPSKPRGARRWVAIPPEELCEVAEMQQCEQQRRGRAAGNGNGNGNGRKSGATSRAESVGSGAGRVGYDVVVQQQQQGEEVQQAQQTQGQTTQAQTQTQTETETPPQTQTQNQAQAGQWGYAVVPAPPYGYYAAYAGGERAGGGVYSGGSGHATPYGTGAGTPYGTGTASAERLPRRALPSRQHHLPHVPLTHRTATSPARMSAASTRRAACALRRWSSRIRADAAPILCHSLRRVTTAEGKDVPRNSRGAPAPGLVPSSRAVLRLRRAQVPTNATAHSLTDGAVWWEMGWESGGYEGAPGPAPMPTTHFRGTQCEGIPVCTRGCGRVRVRVAISDPCLTRVPDPCTRGLLDIQYLVVALHSSSKLEYFRINKVSKAATSTVETKVRTQFNLHQERAAEEKPECMRSWSSLHLPHCI
ncbi:hypothetical protein C8J57DRAFT_1258398 [Mycena rebaudengoi]|nr:hypothetical protein C8J57DRAFT_1258398 [Mycena rebaudengoi]